MQYPMKIAIVSTFYPYRGGIAQFNTHLYKEFSKEHTVKAFNFSRQYPSFLFPGKTQYVTEKDNAEAIPSERILDSINPWTYYTTIKAIRKFQPDFVLFRFWHPFFAPSLGTIAKFLKKDTLIISLLDNVIPHENKSIYNPFIRYFLNQSHSYVVMSSAVEKDLLHFQPNANYLLKQHPLYNHFGAKQERNEALQKYQLSEQKKTLLFFGFIRDYKGLDLLIDAFGKLDESYQLLIAGESYGSFEKYEMQIANNPNKERISVHNRYISDEEVATLFSSADVCVQPYRSATQSGISAVAYHFEVPMIVTNVGGLKEDIRNHETGLIVNEINAEALKDAIIYYFENNMKEKLNKGIIELKKELSWKAFCGELVAFATKWKNEIEK